MKQEIEQIIKNNLPEKMEQTKEESDTEWFLAYGFNQALSQINTSLIADEVLRVVEKIIGEHNAKIINEFQLQGTPDMPMIAYDERLCLIPAMKKATEQTLSTLYPNKENENNEQ